MLLVVAINSLSLAWFNPTQEDAQVNRNLYWINFVCTIIYIVEAVAKARDLCSFCPALQAYHFALRLLPMALFFMKGLTCESSGTMSILL